MVTTLPALDEFYEQNARMAFLLTRTELNRLGQPVDYDNVMTFVTDMLILKYEDYCGNWHPDYGSTFRTYVMAMMKLNIKQKICRPKAASWRPTSSLTGMMDNKDFDVEGKSKEVWDLVPWDALTEDETWLLRLLIEGYSLKAIEDEYIGQSLYKLQRLKQQIKEKLDLWQDESGIIKHDLRP